MGILRRGTVCSVVYENWQKARLCSPSQRWSGTGNSLAAPFMLMLLCWSKQNTRPALHLFGDLFYMQPSRCQRVRVIVSVPFLLPCQVTCQNPCHIHGAGWGVPRTHSAISENGAVACPLPNLSYEHCVKCSWLESRRLSLSIHI